MKFPQLHFTRKPILAAADLSARPRYSTYYYHTRISQNDATKRFGRPGREKGTRHPLVCQVINDGGCEFVGVGEDRVGILRAGSHASDFSGGIFSSSIHEAGGRNGSVLDGGRCVAS